MKRILGAFVLTVAAAFCALAAPSALAQDATKQVNVGYAEKKNEIASGSYAIVVGIDDYADPDVTDLNYCEKDAARFADALKASGYVDERVILLTGTQATYVNVVKRLENLASLSVPQNSTILFYFSGHGFSDGGNNYLILQDQGVSERTIDRNLRLEDVEEMLNATKFERRLMFIDACRSAVSTGARGVGEKGFSGDFTVTAKGTKVFLGTELGKVSREAEDLKSGIFTNFLVEGILGAADAENDGIITISELENYVARCMSDYSYQHGISQVPVSKGEGSPLIPVAARQGEFTETTTGGTTTGGTVEAVTPAGAGSASGFGTLKLTVGLDGVQCYVDGALKGSSAGGAITVENLTPGEHTIKLVKEGYETREFKAQVFAGQVIEKSLNFSKISGIIRVTSNAYPFSIYLDGAYITLSQTASYDVTDVSYGAHTVVLKKSGYADAEYKVNITGSAPVAVQAALTRVYGQLTVITNPSGASVKITSGDDVVVSAGFNGKSFNSGAEASASEPLNLTPGSYTVTISKDGYETITKTVTIARNAPAVIDVELKKKTQPITPAPGTGGTRPPTMADWSKGANKVRTLTGHYEWIYSVAFSPDGRYALTGSGDKTAKLWSIPDGRCVTTLSGHDYNVSSVAFSPDGRYALTGSWDNTANLWSIPDGTSVKTLGGHTGWIYSVAYSHDGRYAITGSDDETAKLWSVPDGALIKTFNGHSDDVSSVAFSPDGRYALTGSRDGTAKIWSITDGTCVRTFGGNDYGVSSVAFSPDGRYALTGSGDKTAKLWSMPDGSLVKTLSGHRYGVWSVAFSPDGRYALTGSGDSTAKLWSVPDGSLVTTLSLPGEVLSTQLSPDGKYILCGIGAYWTGGDWVEERQGGIAALFECAG